MLSRQITCRARDRKITDYWAVKTAEIDGGNAGETH